MADMDIDYGLIAALDMIADSFNYTVRRHEDESTEPDEKPSDEEFNR